jgi:hypothetical protein
MTAAQPTRVYSSRRASVAHLLRARSQYGPTVDEAYCGAWQDSGHWLGTASQTERDQAAALRTCQRCRHRLTEERP